LGVKNTVSASREGKMVKKASFSYGKRVKTRKLTLGVRLPRGQENSLSPWSARPAVEGRNFFDFFFGQQKGKGGKKPPPSTRPKESKMGVFGQWRRKMRFL